MVYGVWSYHWNVTVRPKSSHNNLSDIETTQFDLIGRGEHVIMCVEGHQ